MCRVEQARASTIGGIYAIAKPPRRRSSTARSRATAPSLPGRAKWVTAISPTLGDNETTLGPPLTWIRAGIPRKHDGKML